MPIPQELSPRQVHQLATHRLQCSSEKWLHLKNEFAGGGNDPDIQTATSLVEHSIAANKQYLTEDEANRVQVRAVVAYQRRQRFRNFIRKEDE